MAQKICILGHKGGTGKTTLSHMLCHGMALLGQRAVAVLTDAEREPLSKEGRRYVTVDARSDEALVRVIEKLDSIDGWIGIIDGGANRIELDQHLAGYADLVLLPFRDSQEDVRAVIKDLERFPHAMAVPSQWPNNLWARRSADHLLAQQLDGLGERLLLPVSTVSASKMLLEDPVPTRLPTVLNNACRELARQVLEALHIVVAEAEAPVETEVEPEPEATPSVPESLPEETAPEEPSLAGAHADGAEYDISKEEV